MSNVFEELNDILENPTQTPIIKIYIKRRLINSESFETNWNEVDSNRILKRGSIGWKIDKINPLQSEFSSFDIKLENFDGYYNSDDHRKSFFFGYSLSKSLIKVTCTFKDLSGNLLPSSDTEKIVFFGMLESVSCGELGSTDLNVVGLESLFKQFTANQADISIGAAIVKAPSNILENIKNATIGGEYIFQNQITSDAWFLMPSFNLPSANWNTETTQYDSLWDVLKNLAIMYEANAYVSRKGEFRFIPSKDNQFFNENPNSVLRPCVFYSRCDEIYFEPVSGASITQSQIGATNSNPDSVGIVARAGRSVPGGITTGTVKFNNGVKHDMLPVNANKNLSLSPRKLNFDAFTCEFWFRPSFNCVSGISALKNAFLILSEYGSTVGSGNFFTDGYAGDFKLGFNLYTTGVYDNRFHIDFLNTASCYCDTSTMNFATGSVNFLGIVHDENGISGTADRYRIYFANDHGPINLVGTSAHTGALHPSNSLNSFRFNVYSPVYTSTAESESNIMFIDNLKIHSYAKTDFSDRDIEMAFDPSTSSYDGYSIQGPYEGNTHRVNIQKIKNFSDGVENVRNHIIINAQSNTVIQTSVSTTASIQKYGIKTLEFTNPMIGNSIPTHIASLASYLGTAKKTFDIDVNFNPFVEVFNKINFTYNSPGVIQSPGPFTDGFSEGFGQNNRQISEINQSYIVCETKHDLDKFTTQLKIGEI